MSAFYVSILMKRCLKRASHNDSNGFVTNITELSKETWIGVLRLARKWDMPEVR